MSTSSSNADFHLRSREYTGGIIPTTAVGVASGSDTVRTVVGQTAIISAVNLLARSHPRLIVAVPDAPYLLDNPAGASTLREACRQLAEAVRSSLIVEIADAIPQGVDSIGIGIDAPCGTVYVGANRWTAYVANAPIAIKKDKSSVLGACMAVVLAHGHLYRHALGLSSSVPSSFSLWSLKQTLEPTGPEDTGPVDVGVVWMVGAGAVGAGLAWWLRMIGVVGEWHVIDDDVVKALNVEKSLTFFEEDVRERPLTTTLKCDVVARFLPGAVAHNMRWNEFRRLDLPPPDVIIPVANEDSVRAKVAYLGHPAVIHATTGRAWTSELHRHLSDKDGCMSCRIPADTPRFECATGEVPSPNNENRNDAALPFLSAGAGLLLAAGLLQIQLGEWEDHERNHWRIHFDGPTFRSSHWSCSESCELSSAPGSRARNYRGTRWFNLDNEAARFAEENEESCIGESET